MLKKDFYNYPLSYGWKIEDFISILSIFIWIYIGYKLVKHVYKFEKNNIILLIPNIIIIFLFPLGFFISQLRFSENTLQKSPFYTGCLTTYEMLSKKEKQLPGVIGKVDYICINNQNTFLKENTHLISSRSYSLVYMLLTLVLFLFAIRKGRSQYFKIINRDNPIIEYLIQTLSIIALVIMSINVYDDSASTNMMFSKLFNNLLQMCTFLFITIIMYILFLLIIGYFNIA